MLVRRVDKYLHEWKAGGARHALMLMGARQVGKTTAVREFARREYDSLAEVNFLGNPLAVESLSGVTDADDLLVRLSVLTGTRLEPKKTLLFLDEIQECQDLLTWMKFLAERTNLDTVLSGSLLGLDAYVHVRSLPVGFLRRCRMYPLTFEEFCWASGVLPEVFGMAKDCYQKLEPVPDYLHKRLMSLFYRYLMVGGMPEAVTTYQEHSDLVATRSVQRDIYDLYLDDIAKYVDSPVEARQIKMVYESIPSQLNAPSKRFKYARLEKRIRFANSETAFDWLSQAGIAISVPRARSSDFPLGLSEDRGLFKLFLNDVGLLTSRLTGAVDIELLNGRGTMNFGSIFEAVVAQELVSAGNEVWYLSSKKMGEVDFAIQSMTAGTVLPIEVKSGKDYVRHSALSNLLADEARGIERAVVLHDGNVEVRDRVAYLPVYMAGMLRA